jgi:hypothetical protein
VRILVLSLFVGMALGVSACGDGLPRVPLVDHTGIDEGVYSRDLAYCYSNPPGIGFGNYVSKCLRGKGYTILVGY